MYWSLASGSILHGRELEDRLSARYGIEQRHPLCDQRLIEFAFALPESQRQREGKTKLVLRTATRGIIPERIRQRTDKADFSHTFPEALKAQGGEDLFKSLKSASVGWVVEEKVRATYKQMKMLYEAGNAEYVCHNWPLWMTFGIEMWFSGCSKLAHQH
jgi:asparagine synthase (glutamine-hydrolysing)